MATRAHDVRFWTIRAANDTPDVGEVLLYGPISNRTWWGDEVTPKQFADDLKALGNVKELRIHINSPGGDVFAGVTIHSILRRHSARKVVHVDGLAASAASVVAMAGDHIVMPIGAMLMIHNPWMLVIGDAPTLRKAAEDLEKVEQSMIGIYHARTGLDPERIAKIMDDETWLTAEEAVELGFADEVDEGKQVAASVADGFLVVNGLTVDLRQYRNPPLLVLGHSVLAGVVPEDVSDELAPEDTEWEAPTLSDFTDKRWDELSDAEKRRIAGHYAWAAEMPPRRFEDLKLPHHRPSDGKVVWRGVTAAAQRLDQADIPEADKPRVRAHLQRHYHQFGRKAPWEEDADNRLRLLALEWELVTGKRI